MDKQSLNERLRIYGAVNIKEKFVSDKLLFAASAVAGVGGMLIPPPAEAAIQYSGLKNMEVKDGQSQKVDLGGVNFTFNMSVSTVYSYSGQKLRVVNTEGKVVVKNNKPVNLKTNYDLSSQAQFDECPSLELAVFSSGTSTGNFLGKQGYLGVTFISNGNSHYGWIQYKASEEAKIGTIIDWAYDDTPGKAIKTGATKDPEIKKPFSWNLFLPAILAGGKDNK